MSLLTEAQALATPSGGRCSVGLLVRSLSESEQAELAEALASHVSARALSDALRARGHEIGNQTLQRHRQQVCACPR